MSKSKQLSNSISTGSGGSHFEAHVQAYFVVLMLTGGYAPGLPCWPIMEIKLQGKSNGFETDDIVVFVEDPNSKEQRKLLGQIKRCITITKSNSSLEEVIKAAWTDFQNPVFKRKKDIILLMTGLLSGTDKRSVKWLLDKARYTQDPDEFLRHVQQAKFSSDQNRKKLDAIKYHLKTANDDNEIKKSELHDFLKCFYLLECDLGSESGVNLSLLHTLISQFEPRDPQKTWSRVVDIVQTYNENAGTITRNSLPEDLIRDFKQKDLIEIPKKFKTLQEKSKIDWVQRLNVNAIYLALVVLIGAWNERRPNDIAVVTKLLNITFDEWQNKAREISNFSESPLSFKNGIWKVANRDELFSQLGSQIRDENLDTFQHLAVSILKEPDPAFELPTEKRYEASIYGKIPKYSYNLREGVAEGLAILGNKSDVCNYCSQGKVEEVCSSVLRGILPNDDWVMWGSLNRLLPSLAEAAPVVFLSELEKALRQTPCLFDELFAQERTGLTGNNYLTGLLWALEALAWEEQYVVQVCALLGELANHDPGSQWNNRPSNSLVAILLPCFPQTLAPFEKRKVAVEILLEECPEIAWNLIIQLLPNQHQISFHTNKSRWRKINFKNFQEGAKPQEYWQQISFYSQRAVSIAGHNIDRLSSLIDHFDRLSDQAFDKLIEVLSSEPISSLPEDQRLLLWNCLMKLTNKHRRFSDEEWTLSEQLVIQLEQVSEKLAPMDPLNKYRYLFTDDDFDLYKKNGDWEKQEEELNIRRDEAISEIFQQGGIKNIIQFSEHITSPEKAGYALGAIIDAGIEQALLPQFLDTSSNTHKTLLRCFILRCYSIKGWEWCDSIDRSNWSPAQIGKFLACFPFSKEAWGRASLWLHACEIEYWNCTDANPYKIDKNDLGTAVEKLIKYNRPRAAVNCLNRMLLLEQTIDPNQCVQALICALSSNESKYAMEENNIVKLIEFLQTKTLVNQDDLLHVEFAYLSLLTSPHTKAMPKLLESRLANDPKFFYQVIQLTYRPKKNDQMSKQLTKNSEEVAVNCWNLLRTWKVPPGIQKDGTFREDCFAEWLERVKQLLSKESGYLEVTLDCIGNVLTYAPADPDGLWIHRAVAKVLNKNGSAAETMRNGFIRGKYNSRGVYQADPSGREARKLAEEFRNKAEEVENAKFRQLASKLRVLAKEYDREAESNN